MPCGCGSSQSPSSPLRHARTTRRACVGCGSEPAACRVATGGRSEAKARCSATMPIPLVGAVRAPSRWRRDRLGDAPQPPVEARVRPHRSGNARAVQGPARPRDDQAAVAVNRGPRCTGRWRARHARDGGGRPSDARHRLHHCAARAVALPVPGRMTTSSSCPTSPRPSPTGSPRAAGRRGGTSCDMLAARARGPPRAAGRDHRRGQDAGGVPADAGRADRAPDATGLHTLYVSPLKALAVDIQRNLIDADRGDGPRHPRRDAHRRHAVGPQGAPARASRRRSC